MFVPSTTQIKNMEGTSEQAKVKLQLKQTKKVRIEPSLRDHRAFVKYQLGRPGRPTLADSIIELAKIGLKHVKPAAQ